jgi:hypothetical protein
MSSDDVNSVFFKYHLIKDESARLILVCVNVPSEMFEETDSELNTESVSSNISYKSFKT